MILTIGFAFALGVLFPVLMDSFEESRERTAWVSSITMATLLLLGPGTGAFVNRYGCRLATIIGCLSCALGLGLGSIAPNIIVLFLAFSLPFGIGTSFIYISSSVTMTNYFRKKRSIALGFVTAGQGLGTMICGPVLQVLEDAFGWRNTFLIFAGVLAVSSLTGCFLNGTNQELTSSSTQVKKSYKTFGCDLSLWKSPRFLVLLVMAGLTNFFRMVPYVHLIKHCDDLGIPADKSSTLFPFLGVFAAIGRLGGGCLCDIKCINSLFLYQAAVFVAGTATMLFVQTKTYASLAAVVVMFSVADGLMVSTFIIELFKSVQVSQRAPGLGFCMMAAGILVFCSPPLSGFMADKFGNYVAAFLMAGSVGVLASLIPFILLCTKWKNNSDRHVAYLEELMDKDQNETKKCNGSSNNNPPKITYHIELEPCNPVRTTMVHVVSPKRPVSFMCAMENPFSFTPKSVKIQC
ncbi:hypothetical protein ACROYT_G041622 [Oculina patagonica]